MKLILEISNSTEAAGAAMWLRALSDAFREIESPAPKTNGHGGKRAGAGGARPGAGRPKKVKQAVAAAPEQAAAAVPEQLDLLDAIAAAKQSEHADPVEPVATERERLKAIAIDRGVVWVREIVATRGAARLSELSDEQVRAVLNDA
jgi:hypothetical protein